MSQITIRVTNTRCYIVEPQPVNAQAVLCDVLSFDVGSSQFVRREFNKKHNSQWDGKRRLFHVADQSFPRGLLDYVTKYLTGLGVDVRYDWQATTMPPIGKFECHPSETRQYQVKAMIECITNGFGVVKAATGSGKTTIAAMVAAALGQRCVFIVHTLDLLNQAIMTFNRITNMTVGQVGGGKVELGCDITVATVQTLATVLDIKYENYSFDEDYVAGNEDMHDAIVRRMEILKWMGTVGLVQFDEVQLVASQTAYEVRYKFVNACYAFGYSASPWRDDGTDLMIEAAFGSRIVDITASELICTGDLVQPDIIIKRCATTTFVDGNYSKVYKSAIVDNPLRNAQVLNDAMHYYEQGISTLILVTMISHGKQIEEMAKSIGIPAIFISGNSTTNTRNRVIQDMRDGKATIMIASTIADVGLDIPRLGAIIEAGAGKSSVTALQRLGRVMRKFPGKTKCYFVTYRDNVPFIMWHIDKKIKIWRTEPMFNIIEED